MRKKGKRLVRLKINEVSLVDMGANRRSFAIIKSARSKEMSKVAELLVKLDPSLSGVAEKLESGLMDEQAKKLAQCLEKIAEYKDCLPEAVCKAISEIITSAPIEEEESFDVHVADLLRAIEGKIAKSEDATRTAIEEKLVAMKEAMDKLQADLAAVKEKKETDEDKNKEDDESFTFTEKELEEFAEEVGNKTKELVSAKLVAAGIDPAKILGQEDKE